MLIVEGGEVVLVGREEGGGLEVVAVQVPLQDKGLGGVGNALARARVIREIVLTTELCQARITKLGNYSYIKINEGKYK